MDAGGEQGHVPRGQLALGTWGMGGLYLSAQSVIRLADPVTRPRRYQRIESAPSWMPSGRPERLTAVLLDFLGG